MARYAAAAKALGKLRRWAERDEWAELCGEIVAEHLGPVCAALDLGIEDLAAMLDEHSLAMVTEAAFEDFLMAELDDGRNIISEYLAQRGWNESAATKKWLRGLRDSRFGLWEVVALAPGRSMTLQDLLAGGEPIVVDERLGSQSAVLWDRLTARVVTVDGDHYLSGTVLLFTRPAAEAAVRRFRDLVKKLRGEVKRAGGAAGEPIDELRLREHASQTIASAMLTQEWLMAWHGAQTAPPPELRNSDGELFLPAEARLPILGTSSEVVKRLDSVPSFDCQWQTEAKWDWIDLGGEPPRQPDPGPRRRVLLQSHDPAGRTILGSVAIDGQEVVLETNSRERADRGLRLLADTLGGLVGGPSLELRSADVPAGEKHASPMPRASGLSPQDEATILRDYLDRHYRECLDQPVPMLSGKSPRESVRTKKGRDAVASWLKFLENSEARGSSLPGQQRYDFVWMWHELGIADLRR
jgi:hypothetical protein